MKSKEIQEALCKQEVLKGNLPCENISIGMAEMDVVSVLKSGLIAEYEVKISRSDFIADAKKDKWKFFQMKIETMTPNYFYYACPDNLIKEIDLKPFMGLVYVKENGIRVVKKAKRLHSYKHDLLKILTKFCRVKSERQYLGSCLLTYLNNRIINRNKAIKSIDF